MYAEPAAGAGAAGAYAATADGVRAVAAVAPAPTAAGAGMAASASVSSTTDLRAAKADNAPKTLRQFAGNVLRASRQFIIGYRRSRSSVC